MKDKNFTCPYCFEKIPYKKVKYVCCREPFMIAGKFKPIVKCRVCKKETMRKICPECSQELPYTFGYQDDCVISIIGAKEAGKSHYIAVLLNTLMEELGMAYQCTLTPLNDETIRRYKNDFYDPLFRRKETIQVTMSGRANSAVQRPLLYSLSFHKKGLLGNRKIISSITLAFFDTAGEDLDAEDTMSVVNKYIYNSDGIIVLVDPLQLTELREMLKEKVQLPQENTEIGTVIARVSNLIRKAKHQPVGLLDIPLAVTFSKMDVLFDENIIDENSTIRKASKHIENKRVDQNEFKTVSNEMEALLRHLEGKHFMSQVENHFQKYCYFGMSALGSAPSHNNKIAKFKPHRVEDPLLWILKQNNVIK